MDNFEKWCSVKKEVANKKKIIGIKERNIVFAHVGKDVGLFVGIPLTSQEEEGYFYQKLECHRKDKIYHSTAVLSQIRVFDTKRAVYTKGMVASV